MRNLIRIGRIFYGIGIAGLGIQQFIYAGFRPVLLAYWPASLPSQNGWAYVVGGLLVIGGAVICIAKNAKGLSLALGFFFLLLFLCSHVYYQVFLSPYDFHFGSWTDALKDLTLSGGAFIVAVSYSKENSIIRDGVWMITGRIFFSILLIVFGIDHFLYTTFVATLVPNWIPGHVFWTYFGGVALAGSGICILLKLKIRLVSLLLGGMLFAWFIILHMPRAIADPNGAKGNEVTSVFEALAFSGIAFLIAELYRKDRLQALPG